MFRFLKGSLAAKSYADRFYFDESIDEAEFFEHYICSADFLARNYENFRTLDENPEVTGLYALIMAEIGKRPLHAIIAS